MNSIKPALAVMLPAALAGSGCDDASGPRVCTLVGCDSGLDVVLVGNRPDTFTLLLDVPPFQPLIVECSPSKPCGDPIHIPDFLPDLVFIEIRGADVEFRGEFRPIYETLRPNGIGCPPECRQGEVVVDLP